MPVVVQRWNDEALDRLAEDVRTTATTVAVQSERQATMRQTHADVAADMKGELVALRKLIEAQKSTATTRAMLAAPAIGSIIMAAALLASK
jgi:hypothetical protein